MAIHMLDLVLCTSIQLYVYMKDFFHSRTVHLDVIKVFFFYLPTDAQQNGCKKNIKIYIITAPTCSVQSPSSVIVLFELAKLRY